MQISQVQLLDLETLRSFSERTFRIAFQEFNDPIRFEEYCEMAFSTAKFQQEMEHLGSKFWFGKQDDVLAAYLKLNFDRHAPELKSDKTVQVERLYVAPAFQGQRMGEQMLDFAQEQARTANAEWIWLSVWQENPPAVRFYERCGFEIFGNQIFWLGDEAQTDLLMGKKV